MHVTPSIPHTKRARYESALRRRWPRVILLWAMLGCPLTAQGQAPQEPAHNARPTSREQTPDERGVAAPPIESDSRQQPADSAKPSIPADRLIRLRPTNGHYRFTLNDDPSQKLAFEVEAVPGKQGLFSYELQGRRVSYLRENEAGDVLLVRHDQRVRNSRIKYEPPMRFLPSELVLGKVYEGHSQMQISPIEGEGNHRQGKTWYAAQWAGRRDIKVPLGRFEDAPMLRFHREISVGPIKVIFKEKSAYDPAGKLGLIYSKAERVMKLGFLRLERVRTLIERVD
jgi:hypothetical protein